VVSDSAVGRQRQVDENFTEKEIRSRIAIEQQGMFAAPAQAAIGRELGFKNGCRVGEYAIGEFADLLLDAVGKLLQAVSEQLVVIAADSVARNICGIGVGKCCLGVGAGATVIQTCSDDAAGTRHEFGGAGALVSGVAAVRGHIIHLAVAACRKPGGQPGFCRAEVDPGEADRVET